MVETVIEKMQKGQIKNLSIKCLGKNDWIVYLKGILKDGRLISYAFEKENGKPICQTLVKQYLDDADVTRVDYSMTIENQQYIEIEKKNSRLRISEDALAKIFNPNVEDVIETARHYGIDRLYSDSDEVCHLQFLCVKPGLASAMVMTDYFTYHYLAMMDDNWNISIGATELAFIKGLIINFVREHNLSSCELRKYENHTSLIGDDGSISCDCEEIGKIIEEVMVVVRKENELQGRQLVMKL